MIDLRLASLRAFIAVADEGHFGRAARALGVGQPAVSGQLRRLETALGVELILRTSRTVRLTPAGEHFLPIARAALQELDRGVAEVDAVAAGRLGTLRVAAQQAARGLVVPGVLARLARDVPELTLDVRPTTTAAGLGGLLAREFDVALVRDPDPRAGVVTEVLATDPLMIVLPVAHRLAARASLPLSALRGEPRIGWTRGGAPELHDQIGGALHAAGVDPAPRMELRGVDVRLGAVAGGLGYAIESSAYRWILGDRVRFVAIEGEPLHGAIVAAWPAVRPAPGVPAFLHAARAAAAEAEADAVSPARRRARPAR